MMLTMKKHQEKVQVNWRIWCIDCGYEKLNSPKDYYRKRGVNLGRSENSINGHLHKFIFALISCNLFWYTYYWTLLQLFQKRLSYIKFNRFRTDLILDQKSVPKINLVRNFLMSEIFVVRKCFRPKFFKNIFKRKSPVYLIHWYSYKITLCLFLDLQPLVILF